MHNDARHAMMSVYEVTLSIVCRGPTSLERRQTQTYAWLGPSLDVRVCACHYEQEAPERVALVDLVHQASPPGGTGVLGQDVSLTSPHLGSVGMGMYWDDQLGLARRIRAVGGELVGLNPRESGVHHRYTRLTTLN